jgi:hypothetical protein
MGGAGEQRLDRGSCFLPMNATRSRGRAFEVVATVLLAVATVATAWAAYQSRQWTGVQAQQTSHATAARIAVNRSAAVANRQLQIDVATFIQWVNAHLEHRAEVADFYRARFRDEFKPAFSAWLATQPFSNAAAPETPFALPEYRLKASAEADRLEAKAAADSNEAKAANQRASNYMLAVVLFASALFFAGISSKVESSGAKVALLAIGCILFLGTVVFMATFPARLTV